MADRTRKNNVLAGLFLIASMVLAVAISFWLGGVVDRLGSKTTYRVVFPVADGARGLKPDSPVTLGGYDIGRVTRVRPMMTTDESTGYDTVTAIEVTISVDSGVVLYEDASPELIAPLLGGMSSINLAGVGSGKTTDFGADGDGLLEAGEALRGYGAPGLLAQVGLGPEQTAKIEETIAWINTVPERAAGIEQKINDFMDTANQIALDIQPKAGPSAKSLHETLANIESFSVHLKDDGTWGKWKGQVDATLAGVRTFTDELPRRGAKFDDLVLDTKGAVGEVRQMIEVNRPAVRETIDHTLMITQRFRFETMDQVSEVLNTGKGALSSYGELGDQFNLIVDREYPGVRQTLADVRAGSAQAKLAIEELRAQPWRVLKQPSKKEMEREPLYRAARSYAAAVSDLRVASEALESVIARGRANDGTARAPAVDAASIMRLTEAIQRAFAEYEKAEQGMLDALREQGQ